MNRPLNKPVRKDTLARYGLKWEEFPNPATGNPMGEFTNKKGVVIARSSYDRITFISPKASTAQKQYLSSQNPSEVYWAGDEYIRKGFHRDASGVIVEDTHPNEWPNYMLTDADKAGIKKCVYAYAKSRGGLSYKKKKLRVPL